MNRIFRYWYLLLSSAISIGFISCIKNDPIQPSGLSSDKSITYFGFKVTNNLGLSGDIDGIIGQDTIKLILPYSVPRNNLMPTVIFTGKSISPESNVAQNFNTPFTYTVTAEDGTTKKYIVV